MKFWLAILLMVVSQQSMATTIELESHVQINSSNITLFDVVQNRKDLPARLLNSVIDRAPRFGVTKKISKKVIKQSVIDSGFHFEISGPEYILIKPVFNQFDVSDYCDLSRDALSEKINSDINVQRIPGAEVILESVGKQKPLNLPEGKYSFKIDKITPKMINSRMFVNGSVFVDGVSYQSLQFEFDVKVYSYAWQVINAAEKTGRVKDYVKRKWVNVLANLEDVFLSEKINDLRFSYDVRAGNLLRDKYVEKIPLIESGNKVMVISSIGQIYISAQATANSDGELGDVIELYRDDENRIFSGKVIDEKQVVANTW
jgi:flagella basal body P-ring formation protein FlgA